MKMPEPVACLVETEHGPMVWPIADFDEAGTYCEPDELPEMLVTVEQMKQYGRDLLEAAAVECETQCRNISEKLYGKDLAVTIRSMKETL